VSFILSETLQLKKLALLDVVMESHKGSNQPGKDEAFDADVAIATGELCQLLPDLIDALGGEQVMGGVTTEPAAVKGPDAPVTSEPAPWD
jgi:recombination associated protein RdgC